MIVITKDAVENLIFNRGQSRNFFMPAFLSIPHDFLKALSVYADAADAELTWPNQSWQVLRQSGVLAWSLPKSAGGQDRSPQQLLEGYGELAGACLTTVFLLSQREAACRRLRDSENSGLQNELLPDLARGDIFATVGLSQLTTSRQHTTPTMTARWAGQELVLTGVMPWVTGAAHADYFVTGAVLPDGKQMLAVVPALTPGLEVGPALDLMALRGSLTAEVRCREVALEKKWILAGPADQVLAGKHGGTGGLETTCLALGLAEAAISWIKGEAGARPELNALAEPLQASLDRSRGEMFSLAESGLTPQSAGQLRGRANRLVLRATQTALTASKGAGFVHPHPAQRWARQALFFLVWSCPRPATEATLAYLTQEEGSWCG
jgi:alkylation response protein AidB-like acyl-CoA dehydrogenase